MKTSSAAVSQDEELLPPRKINQSKILVCLGTGGIAAGGKEVFSAFQTHLAEYKVSAKLGKRSCAMSKTGCRGLCSQDVLVDIITPELGRVTYAKVKPSYVPKILEEHLLNKEPVKKWVLFSEKEKADNNFYVGQSRFILRNCGSVDPEEIKDYLANKGYEALRKALKQSPESVIEEIIKAQLRGRGGAGFLTGLKWEISHNTQADQKYIICNAQECDPGTFKDRSLLEGDPHSIIEGLLIGAYAIGASKGYICIHPQYTLAIERMGKAIAQAAKKGFIGSNILKSGFSFELQLRRGVTTFSCGESTALIRTLEGERGYPKLTPPHSAVSGLWGKPTIVNNVETFANVALIMLRGADWYSSIGTKGSKGTKVFSLAGKIKNIGLIEVPMGTPMKDVIYSIGGGIPKNKKFKSVQVGGPLGGFFPEDKLDTPVDYDSFKEVGSTVGSGGLLVIDENTCMVELAKHYLEFTQAETCGKCAPCRLGTEVLYEILERITKGEGVVEDLELIESLSGDIKDFALCGLGKTGPNPAISAIKYFREEFKAHIVDKRCPARECKPLLEYKVDEKTCKKCGLCFKKCPQEAVLWQPKQLAKIDEAKCGRCGKCVDACSFQAIY